MGKVRWEQWCHLTKASVSGPEQSQNLNRGCLDPMTGLRGPERGLSARMKVTVRSAIISPHLPTSPHADPTSLLPAVIRVPMIQWSWAVFLARTLYYSRRKARFWCWGMGDRQEISTQAINTNKILKNILLPLHTRAADGGGGSRRCRVLLFCRGDVGTDSTNWTPM